MSNVPEMDVSKFTAIEQQTLRLYCEEGYTTREIAAMRFRSPSTVSVQLERIKTKVKARTLHHLVVLYWRWRDAGDREYRSWGPKGADSETAP